MVNKIKIKEELAGIIEKEKKNGKKIGFTNGCFDIIHLGHIRYLKKAKENCDLLVVGVNSDESVKRLGKGEKRPLNPEPARTEVLAALESVDYITVFGEDTPEKLIEEITPDLLFKGGDWKEEDIVGSSHVKSNGGEVIVIPFEEGYSTTALVEKIKKNG